MGQSVDSAGEVVEALMVFAALAVMIAGLMASGFLLLRAVIELLGHDKP